MLALDVERKLAFAAGQCDIGLARLTGAIHHTPHHRHERPSGGRVRGIVGVQGRLDTPGQFDHIDLHPPAGGTGNHARPGGAQPERTQ